MRLCLFRRPARLYNIIRRKIMHSREPGRRWIDGTQTRLGSVWRQDGPERRLAEPLRCLLGGSLGRKMLGRKSSNSILSLPTLGRDRSWPELPHLGAGALEAT